MEPPPLSAEVRATLPESVIAFIDWIVADNARLRDLLNRNSTNSSIPPSKNPLNAKLPPKAPPTGKKRGGQPGHPKRMRAILEPTRIIDIHPVACSCCGDLLLGAER